MNEHEQATSTFRRPARAGAALVASLAIAVAGASWVGCGDDSDDATTATDAAKSTAKEATDAAKSTVQEATDEASSTIDQATDAAKSTVEDATGE